MFQGQTKTLYDDYILRKHYSYRNEMKLCFKPSHVQDQASYTHIPVFLWLHSILSKLVQTMVPNFSLGNNPRNSMSCAAGH